MLIIPNEGWKFRFDWKSAADNLTQNLPTLFAAIHSQEPATIKLALIPFVGMITCFECRQTDSALLNRFVQNSIAGALTDIIQFYLIDQLDKLDQLSLRELTAPSKAETVIDPYLFEKPGESVLSKTYLHHLCALLTQLNVEPDQIDQIRVAWPICFTTATRAEWVSDGDYAQKLSMDRFLGPMDPYLTALKKEQDYKQTLCKKMTDGLYDGCCTLNQIYIDLQAVCQQYSGYQEEMRTCFLEADLLKWCDNHQPGMVVVQGDPGSGKSTVLKKVTLELVRRGKHVIYIDLFRLPFSGQTDCLETLMKELDNLDWYRKLELEANPDTVYILDGLDEIKADVWNCARNLTCHLVGSKFFDTQKIILSGRISIIRHCEEQLGYLDCYTLLPLTGNENTTDLRPALWTKLCTALNLSVPLESLMVQEHLKELSTSPLLLFLLAWTFRQEPNAVFKIKSTVQLYDKILRCIYHRQHGRNLQNPAGSRTDFKSYKRILGSIGLCAYLHQRRIIPLSYIEEHCTFTDMSAEYTNWFLREQEEHTSRLFLLFFAHEGYSEQNDSTFEFLHKSFYEYLASEELIHQLYLLPTLKPDIAFKRLSYMMRYLCLDMDLPLYDNYLHEIIERYSTNGRDFYDVLRYAFSLLDPHHISWGLMSDYHNSVPDSHGAIRATTNFFTQFSNNLWFLANHFYSRQQVNQDPQILDFTDLYLLDQIISIHNLSFVDFSETRFVHCTMNKGRISHSIWNGSYFLDSLFACSDLRYATGIHMHLTDSGFPCSNLAYSEFRGSEFESVLLEGCNLSKIQFHHCTFSNCSFKNSNLSNSLFDHGCTFNCCNFENAILKNVKIKDLIMHMRRSEGMKILSHANLDGVDWEGVSAEARKKLLQMSKEWHDSPAETQFFTSV